MRRPRSSTLFPYTTLFRSRADGGHGVGHAPAVAVKGRQRVQVDVARSEEHTSELQSRSDLVCRLLREKTNPVAFSVLRPVCRLTPITVLFSALRVCFPTCA